MKATTVHQKFTTCSTITLTLLSMTLPAMAGPPFATDDPIPVEYHHSEFYVASQLTKTADGTEGTLPMIEYNYGAAPNLMVHIVVPYAFTDPKDGSSEHGLGDIELGVKYLLLEEKGNLPAVGIFPLVIAPSGDDEKGLGNGSTQVFLPVWLQKNWDEWQTNFGGGYWINDATGAKNHWFFGWQLQRKISESLTLGGEIYYSSEEADGEGDSSGFNIGGIYDINEHNHLLLSVGGGLSNISATNEFSSYLGYQVTW
jgi:hypothetical protein